MSDVRIGKGAGSLRLEEIKRFKAKARGGGVMFAVQKQRLLLMESCEQPIVVEQWGRLARLFLDRRSRPKTSLMNLIH